MALAARLAIAKEAEDKVTTANTLLELLDYFHTEYPNVCLPTVVRTHSHDQRNHQT